MQRFLWISMAVLLLAACNNDITSLDGQSDGSATDIDGNIYPTVKIGNQVWMAADLRAVHYEDGTEIPLAPELCVTATYPDSYEAGAQCFERDKNTFPHAGVYYNWAALTRARNCQSPSPTAANKTQGPCPKGWRVPSMSDWQILINNLGGFKQAGGNLKALTDWIAPNTGATNASLLNMWPVGQYLFTQQMVDSGRTDAFDQYGYYGIYWAADEGNTWIGKGVYLHYNTAELYTIDEAKTAGICLRCLQEDTE